MRKTVNYCLILMFVVILSACGGGELGSPTDSDDSPLDGNLFSLTELDLSANAENAIELNLPDSAATQSFKVYWSRNQHFADAQSRVIDNQSSFLFSTEMLSEFSPGDTVYVSVTVIEDGVEKNRSPITQFVIPPLPPTDLQVVGIGSYEVNISWKGKAEKYNIYWSTDPELNFDKFTGTVQIKGVGNNYSHSFVDAEPGDSIYFFVSSVEGGVESFASEVVSFKKVAIGIQGAPDETVYMAAIEITPNSATIPLFSTQSLAATAIFSDNSTEDITSEVLWKKLSAIVTVDENGVVFGNAPGTATVTATLDGIVGNTSITVLDSEEPLEQEEISITSLSISPDDLIIPVDSTHKLTVTAEYSDGSTADVSDSATWESKRSLIVTVGPNGTLQSNNNAGDAIVIATIGGIFTSTQVTVGTKELVSLDISQSTVSLAEGETEQFTVIATFNNGKTMNFNEFVEWKSNDISIASVDGAGVVTAVKGGGTTKIEAKLADTAIERNARRFVNHNIVSPSVALLAHTVEKDVSVIAKQLTNIKIVPELPSVEIGLTTGLTLDAVGTYTDTSIDYITESVNWTSSNLAVATIDATGRISANAAGETDITAELDGYQFTTKLTVTPTPLLITLSISATDSIIDINSSMQMEATGSYSDGGSANLTSDVIWSTKDPYIATINSEGMLTAYSAGVAEVRAVKSSRNDTETVIVNPADRAYVAADNSIIVIDTATESIINTINLLVSTYDVAIHAHLGKAYITNDAEDTVTVYDLINDEISSTIEIGAGSTPQAIAINPFMNKVYVANVGDSISNGTVSVIDTITDMVIATVDVGVSPVAIAVADKGNSSGVFVANFADADNGNPGSVSVIDAVSNTIIHSAISGVGDCPIAIAYQRFASKVWVLNNCSDGSVSISAIGTTSKAITNFPAVIEATGSVGGIAVDPANAGYLYVSHTDQNKILVIDSVTNNIKDEPVSGNGPSLVGYDLSQGKIYSVDCLAGTITPIEAESNLPLSAISIGGCPTGMAVVD